MARIIPRTSEEMQRAWDEAEACGPFAPPRRPTGASILGNVPRISDVPEIVQEWIWNGRLPVGHVTALFGPRGSAKSYFIAELAAKLSRGEPWPDELDKPNTAGETLIITGEDDLAAVIAPRVRKCGVDGDKVRVLDVRREDGRPGEMNLRYVEQIAEAMPGLKLVIIDPFAEVLGPRNDRRTERLKVLLNQLARFAERRRVAIILVNATDRVSKGKTSAHGVDVLHFLQAGARAVWSLEEDPSETGRFLWLTARANLAESKMGLAFRIDGPSGKIDWDPEPVPLRADDLKAANRPATKVARAGKWLRTFLGERSRGASEVLAGAALEGLSRGTLYEAKRRLGILSDKSTDTADGQWFWVLPEWLKEAESPQDSKIMVGVAEASEVGVSDSEGITCPAPLPSPPPHRGEGPRKPTGTPRCDVLLAANTPECQDLPQDSKMLVGVAKPTDVSVSNGQGIGCAASVPGLG